VDAEAGDQPAVTVQAVVRASARVGEGPVWDPIARSLWWVDIPAGLVHRSNLDTGATTTLALPTQVGAVAPDAHGGLVVACAEGFGAVSADGTFEIRLASLGADSRMNDAKCDLAGRLWAGSTEIGFTRGGGALHRLRPDWTSEVVVDGLTLPNGIGWSPDSSVMYLADSMERTVEAFDFDPSDGKLSGRRMLASFTEQDGMPDGLCVDTSGALWVAMWGGAKVLRVSPRGQVTAAVAMPVRQPSSCAFTGAGLDVLCVTSASEGLDLPEGGAALDGSIFALTGTGARGTVPARFGEPQTVVARA
jgi:sugar lactone lactonase YvrE